MRKAGRAGLVLLAAAALALPAVSSADSKKKPKTAEKAARADFDTKLPVIGTRLAEFPPGEGKAIADSACLACHSTDPARGPSFSPHGPNFRDTARCKFLAARNKRACLKCHGVGTMELTCE